LDYLNSKNEKNKKYVWISLREEPIIYINGKPFVLRNIKNPLKNIEHTGINQKRVEELENRLKMDIKTESLLYDGKSLVFDEYEDYSIYGIWEDVGSNSGVLTAKDIYKMVKDEGYNVFYHRLPVFTFHNF
jgi:hypothetical protein